MRMVAQASRELEDSVLETTTALRDFAAHDVVLAHRVSVGVVQRGAERAAKAGVHSHVVPLSTGSVEARGRTAFGGFRA